MDARTIEDDLEKRRLENEQRVKIMKLVERWVLALKVDWGEFHKRLDPAGKRDGLIPCNHTTSATERVLAKMGLDKKAIEICLQYFAEIGGHCDCEIAFNVDMTKPQPRPDFGCHDCGHDFDEFHYMVHNRVWDASGLSRKGGLLCIGCLEKRIGRQLRPKDFITKNPMWGAGSEQSLRLQDRRTTAEAPRKAKRRRRLAR